jgi:hypothetical protein
METGGRPKLISEGTGVWVVDLFSVGIDVASFSKVQGEAIILALPSNPTANSHSQRL